MTLNELSQLYWLKKEIEVDEKRLIEDGKTSAEIEEIIKPKKERCIAQRVKLEKYIASIPDSLTRMIFTLRFVKGFSYAKISVELGEGFTDMSIRQRIHRYLKNK